MGEYRYQVSLDQQMVDRLKADSGISNNREFFNSALQLLSWYVRERSAGHVVGALDEQADRFREVIVPAVNVRIMETSQAAAANGGAQTARVMERILGASAASVDPSGASMAAFLVQDKGTRKGFSKNEPADGRISLNHSGKRMHGIARKQMGKTRKNVPLSARAELPKGKLKKTKI